jgi:aspartyl protease family protein
MKVLVLVLFFTSQILSQIPQIAAERIPKVIAKPKVIPKNQPKVNDSECYFVNSKGKVINLSALCGFTEGRQLPKGTFQARIKRREGGIPVIDVNFGNQKFEMIVDTGASGTIITTDMAQALGVMPVSKALINTVSANNVEMPLGYVKRMEVDGIAATNVLVGIIPALRIGLLGNDFFGEYEMTVKRDRIEFRVPSK